MSAQSSFPYQSYSASRADLQSWCICKMTSISKPKFWNVGSKVTFPKLTDTFGWHKTLYPLSPWSSTNIGTLTSLKTQKLRVQQEFRYLSVCSLNHSFGIHVENIKLSECKGQTPKWIQRTTLDNTHLVKMNIFYLFPTFGMFVLWTQNVQEKSLKFLKKEWLKYVCHWPQ